MNDLTEKLKELLMRCDCGTSIGPLTFRITDAHYVVSPTLADLIARQLAPEIEKMIPRWIAVSERLPDDGQMVDLWNIDCRHENMTFKSEDNNRFFIEVGGLNMIALYGDDDIYWREIPKGPTG